jgi:hypothetical protein
MQNIVDFNATTGPAQPPRSVTGQNIARKPRSAGARAFLAADLIRGKVVLEKPTIGQACAIAKVSYLYVKAALEATPTERLQVERGQRSFGNLYAAKMGPSSSVSVVPASPISLTAPALPPAPAPVNWADAWEAMSDAERQSWAASHSDELWEHLDHATAAVSNSTANGKLALVESR